MKTTSRLAVACCAAVLVATASPSARSAHNALALGDAEPQYGTHLCWAAADVLAVNQFYKNCPTTMSPNPGLIGTSQSLEAAYQLYNHSGNLTSANLASLKGTCEGNIQACNSWGEPLLTGLSSNRGFTNAAPTVGSNSTGLTWGAMMKEIDAGRPVLFVWDYPDNDPSNLPAGPHELVATGYSDERDSSGTQYLLIWDPWPPPTLPMPVSAVPECGPAPGVNATPQHSRWVHFSTYTHVGSDMGVTVNPSHDSDRWGLAMITPSAPVLTIESATRPLPQPPTPYYRNLRPPRTPLAEMSFAEALSTALPESRQIDLQVSGAAPRTLGVPFPIVGLGLKKLLSAQHDPTALLAGKTSAILFPVESQGEVVDAFLMLLMDGRWQRGGYANLEITQRLVDVRARYAARKHLPVDSFYLVSVPGEVAFFAAHGARNHAVLIPASTDLSIDAIAGQAAPAGRQLHELIVAVRRDLQPYEPRHDPRRPGG